VAGRQFENLTAMAGSPAMAVQAFVAGHGRPGRLTLDVIGRYLCIYTPSLSQVGRYLCIYTPSLFTILYTADRRPWPSGRHILICIFGRGGHWPWPAKCYDRSPSRFFRPATSPRSCLSIRGLMNQWCTTPDNDRTTNRY
jgi:hypothetical protein